MTEGDGERLREPATGRGGERRRGRVRDEERRGEMEGGTEREGATEGGRGGDRARQREGDTQWERVAEMATE